MAAFASVVLSLEEGTGFPHKHGTHPPGTHTHLTLLSCAAESGENSAHIHVCGCARLFMHELSTPELCTDQQGSLNSPTVKCVTFNLSLPFGFHIMHYQQWLFSTQVPFRKLSAEKGTHIKETERDNVSDA